MRILFVHQNLCPGGAERQLTAIATYLIKRGYSVQLLLKERKGIYLQQLEDIGACITCFPKPGKHTNLYLELVKEILFLNTVSRNSDVVFTFLPHWNFVAELSCLSSKKRLITGARSCDSLFIGGTKYKILYRLYSISDIVIANSYNTKKDIVSVNKKIEDRVRVIYNVVNIPHNIIKQSEEYVPLKNKRVKIVVPANYGESKNIMGVIAALRLIDVRYLDQIEIHWYGVIQKDSEVNYYDIANEEIEKYNFSRVIKLNDTTPNIYSIMAQADVIGLFSKSEGFPNVICEGMSLGKPVISTPVSDIPTILSNSKNFIAASCSPEDIANAIVNMIKNIKNDYKEASFYNRSKAAELFSSSNFEEIEKILENIVNKNHRL